jgi:hypothetical protein
MATEVLTGYTETGDDASASTGYFRESSTTATVVALPTNIVALLSYDFGADFFTNRFYAEGDLNVSASTGGAVAKSLGISFARTLADIASAAGTTYHAGLLIGASADNTVFTNYALYKEAGTGASVNGISTNSIGATHYYYRVGVLSSLGGQYGCLVVQLFSDSGRTTLVVTTIKARTAATNYRYFLAAQSSNNASAGTVSATNADITLFYPSAGTDLTTFTEVDASAYLVPYADCMTITNCRGDVYDGIYKDYTAGYFSAGYTVGCALNLTAFTNVFALHQILRLSNNALTASTYDASTTVDAHAVQIVHVSTTTYQLQAVEVTGATKYASTSTSTLTEGVPYWVTLTRDTAVGTYGTLYLKVYNDPTLLSQVGSTVSLTLHDNGTPDNVAFRYLHAFCSHAGGGTPANLITGTVGGLTVSVPTHYTITADTQTYTLTGIAATFHSVGILTATTQTYTFTGIAASLRRVLPNLTADTQTYALTGIDVAFALGTRKLTAEVQTYTLTGKDAILGLYNTVQGEVRVHTLTGIAVNFRFNRNLVSDLGVFALTGIDNILTKRRSIAADLRSYSLTGIVAGLSTTTANLEKITWRIINLSTGVPIDYSTGLIYPTITISRMSDGAVYDWSDETFKLAGISNADGDMIEVNPTYLPGVYEKAMNVSGFDGRYQIFGKYLGSPPQYTPPMEMELANGTLWSTVVTDNLDTTLVNIAAVPTAVWNKTLP